MSNRYTVLACLLMAAVGLGVVSAQQAAPKPAPKPSVVVYKSPT